MHRNVTRAVELAALGKELIALRRGGKARGKRSQRQVVDRLARLHGLPQKIGQILSLTELMDDAPIFTPLVEAPAQLSAPEAFAEIERALGRPWRTCFRFLEPEGISASLAQVHRGITHDGRDVVVKIQYPGMAEALELDLKALGWLTAPLGGLRKGFDLRGYRREVGMMLREELDYRHEAEMLNRFRIFASGLENVVVPEVIEELSGERILTMTWLDESNFSKARRWPLDERAQVGATLVSVFFASVFSACLLHADPHPGNYRFQHGLRGVTVGVLDFGCVKSLAPETSKALLALIADTIAGRLQGNAARARLRFEALGFQPLLLAPMQHLLPELCEILFEPFLRDQPFDMKTWRLGARVEKVVGDFRWNSRIAGPPTLIYFMRAYQGLVQYVSALEAPVNWRAAYEQAGNPQAEEPIPWAEAHASKPAKSEFLRVRVSREGRTRAELTFPVAAAEDLCDLIPPEVEPKLAARHIDVLGISQSAIAEGFPPGELFSLREGEDNFRVWLE
ncbi:MAG: AarF/ABC1/UbiB kinase family protein [Candidatus Acidiferrales bacterium]